MTVMQTLEGNFVTVEHAYLKQFTTPEGEDIWVLADQDGRPCLAANYQSELYFWAMENDINLVTLQ